MNWKPLLTPQGLADAAIAAGLVLLGIWKKEAQDGFKALCAWAWAGLLRLLRRLVGDETDKQALVKGLDVMLAANKRGLTTLLLLMEEDFGTDRASFTEYTVGADGIATVTCITEVRKAEMNSVEDLQATPLPAPLWQEISRIPHLPDRVLYVPDARTSSSAAVQEALLASGAWSAYYQVMPDPEGKYNTFTMLSLSWHRKRLLLDTELRALHQSGVTCATVCITRQQAKQLKNTLTGPGG